MISVKNDYAGNAVTASKQLERLSTGKANGAAEGTEKGSVVRRDVFEYSSEFGALTTYSQETSRRSEVTSGVAYVSSTTNTASTYQLRYIPSLLAAKMANLSTTSTGPVINSGTDYQNYQNAMATIKGNHSFQDVLSYGVSL